MQMTTETPVLSSKLVEPMTTSQVSAALALLGIDVPATDVRSVRIESGAIKVVVFLRDEQGRMMVAGKNEAAQVEITAPVSRD